MKKPFVVLSAAALALTVASPVTAPPANAYVAGTKITKVLTIVEENHSLDQMRSGMPYLYGLAQRYGYATDWRAITHPSLPNYLAIAGGHTFGVTDNQPPASHPISGRSVFGAAIAAGRTAKSYQDGMPTYCTQSTWRTYAVKHNPWAYFSGERAWCNNYDVPAGTTTSGRLRNDIVNGRLPNVGEITPDLCHDAHDCSLATADAWLKSWLAVIFAGPDWKSGHLAIVVTADEDDTHAGNRVLTAVLHPSLDGKHKVVTTTLHHYSLTQFQTRVAHAACLNKGCTAPSMVSAFGLPV